MQTKEKLGGIKERIFIHRMLGISLASLAVFSLGFIIAPYIMAEASASQYADATVSWGAVSLTLDPDYGNGSINDEGHGDIDFGELVPTANNLAESGSSYGTLKVLKKTIGITSSGKFYTVYISTLTDDNNLSLELSGGGSNSSIVIPAASSAFSAPAGFSDSAWGFAVPGVQATGVPNAPSTFVIPQLLDTQIGAQTSLEGASQTYNSTKWAAVPGNDTPLQIWKAEAGGTAGENYGFGTYTNDQNVEVTGDTTNNHFDIYYAVAVDTDVLAGTYSNHVVYTALANASSLDSVSNNISHDRTFGGTGDTVTIRFDLTQSTVTLDEDDITVTLVPHSVMVANNYDSAGFDIASLGFADSIGYLDCPVVDNSMVVDGYVEVECIMPSSTTADNAGNGAYDFWVHVAGYNYNYVSKDTVTKNSVATTVPAFLYAGLQTDYPTSDARYDSTSGADNHIVKEMQQMSAGVCSNTNMWNNQTGANARIYDSLGLHQLIADVQDTDSTASDYYDSTNYDSADAQNIAQNAAINVGTFALTDNRDQKDYLIRRWEDGNCWMAQTLDLELNDFIFTRNLNRNNTDLNSKEYWDPAKSMYDYALDLADDEGYIGPQVTTTNYFEIASEDRLGEVQTKQFGKINGGSAYAWGSYYPIVDGAKGEKTDNPNNNNALTEIPRSFSFDTYYVTSVGISSTKDAERDVLTRGPYYIGSYYNYYAATAESGKFAFQNSEEATDSICPKGWRMMSSSVVGDASKSLYSITKNLTIDQTKSIPYELAFTGYYEWANKTSDNGHRQFMGTGSVSYSWTPSSSAVRGQARMFNYGLQNSGSESRNNKPIGFSVRCVARD